jgi:hypothetical protein
MVCGDPRAGFKVNMSEMHESILNFRHQEMKMPR